MKKGTGTFLMGIKTANIKVENDGNLINTRFYDIPVTGSAVLIGQKKVPVPFFFKHRFNAPNLMVNFVR